MAKVLRFKPRHDPVEKKQTRDWAIYPNGAPRLDGLERLARHRAAKLGYQLHRSRSRLGSDNAGQYTLADKATGAILLGAGYSASVEAVLEFLQSRTTEETDNANVQAG